MNRAGRRPKYNAKRGRFEMRTDADDEGALEYLTKKTGMDKAGVVREALRIYYAQERYGNW